MNKTITFKVPGIPTAKGRARAFIRNGHIKHYTPEKTVCYEKIVRLIAQTNMNRMQHKPFDGACELSLVLNLPIPSSWSKKKQAAALAGEILPTTKPDCSNVLKAIEDAMNGIVWLDDKQATEVYVQKRYSLNPSAIVTVKQK